MSNLGPPFEDDEDYSPARANAKGVHRDTGANLVALASTKQLGLVIPTDTSGGLIKNVTYYVDYNSSFNRISFEPIFHTHYHDADTNEAGGRFLDILNINMQEFVEVNWVAHQADPAGFWEINASNGVITKFGAAGDSYHMIDTLAATNNHITATMAGARFEWSDIITLIFQTDLNRNTNILARTGLNADRVSDTPSTSRRIMAIEGCDGHGVNWVMLNANGNSGSLVVTATTINLSSGADHTFLMQHIPADKQTLTFDGTLNATSITNIADDGTSERLRLFRWGVKLPAGTLNITQKLYYMRMIGNQKILP
jgi:hypothetical protein